MNPKSEYEPPVFPTPPSSGYLYVAAVVAPPGRAPFVRANIRRTTLLTRLKALATDIEQLPDVIRVTVYRAVLIPPTGPDVPHPARFDVAALIETNSPAALDTVRAAEPYERMLSGIRSVAGDVHTMAARCLRYVGAVDRDRPGLFLFNHFLADDAKVATELWEHLAGWYVTETGLDNSTLLEPIDDDDYVFVNHARWDKSLPRLAAEQFAKKSFRSYVLANLRANHVVAMPGLYRLA